MSDENFLSRWSRLKRTSRTVAESRPTEARSPASEESSSPPGSAPPIAPAARASASVPSAQEPAPLPDVDSLTPESDFSAFMKADVDESLKRRALKKLFEDPRFNVMDGLDVYIDDYSKPDPLPEGWLGRMNQALRLGEYREATAEDPAKSQAQVAGAAEANTEAASLPREEEVTALEPPDQSAATEEKDHTKTGGIPPTAGR